jgi:wyosine [tRNA(Phe)-imidazoG37] synthetase (radical SAM superfamily)
MQIERREFYRPEGIAREVGDRLVEVVRNGDSVDFLSFVPDGEPTLDVNLGREIELLRTFDLPVAVITNASLLSLPDVRQELATADWVSLKVDSVEEDVWRRLNRPHKKLILSDILEGLMVFRDMFSGTLVTETMLVAGVNDTDRHAVDTAAFLSRLKPDKVYLSVPTRPPAQAWVKPPSSDAMVRCHDIFAKQVDIVEYLMGYEGDTFSAAGDPRENLLGVTAVHPMRAQAVTELLDKAGASWAVVEELLRDGSLREVDYAGHRYYLRRPRWN